MKISTFEEDLFDLREFSQQLENFITTEHAFVDGSLVISLSSKYGSGKSTFLNMWRSDIENREEGKKLLVVQLNAWESDYNDDPLYAIVSALIEAAQNEDMPTKSILDAVKDIGWFATAITAQIASKFTGIDPVSAGEVANQKKSERHDSELQKMDAFSVYEARKKAMISLKSAIQELVKSSEPKVLFLVDELDRCRPDYAISYLEAIKHLFDTQGAVFILAADRNQLENSAKTAFGKDLDFEEYYRKFIHREVMLPPISEVGYRRLASCYTKFYIEGGGSRFCFMKIDHDVIARISDLIAALKLTPRQIQEIFRVLGHIFSTTDDQRGRLLWCLGAGSIAMAAFKIGAPKIFESLGNGNLAPPHAWSFLKEIFGETSGNAGWWFELFLTGDGLATDQRDRDIDVLAEVGVISDPELYGSNYLSSFYTGWNRHTSGRFQQIYDKVQEISKWK